MPHNSLKILTLNVRGLNNPVKRRAILHYLEHSKAGICLLQETHLLPKDHHRMKSRAFPTQIFSSNPSKSAGIAILVSRSFQGRVLQKEAEIRGRLLTYQFMVGGMSFIVGSVYAPNEGQDKFFHDALTEATATTERRLLLGGDLNLVFDNDRSCQRTGTTGALSPAGRARLQDLGFIDLWRHFHPLSRAYTFYSGAHKTYARLDYLLSSSPLYALATDTEILTASLSDHSPVIAIFKLPPTQQPLRHWRLRDTLLQHASTVKHIQEAITNYLALNANSDTSLATQWAALKAVIRGEFIAISTASYLARSRKRSELTQRVAELEQMHQQTGASRAWRQLCIERKQLAALDQDRAEYAALHLRHSFYTGGDRCGRLLAHKLREARQRQGVQAIRSPGGELVTDDAVIAEVF